MKRTSFARLRVMVFVAAIAAATATVIPVRAQTADTRTDAAAIAQQRYDLDIAACNGPGIPAPLRASCIRDAGQRLDSLRGVPAATEAAGSADGRATVMTSAPRSETLRGSTTVITSDGRATVVVPEGTATP